MESVDQSKPLVSQLVFLVSKFLEGIVGESYKARKHLTREFLVEVSRQDQADKLLAQTRIADLAIRVTRYRSLNSSQGVISEADMANETEAGLLESLRNQGVTGVRRITIRRDDKEMPTRHIILTFDRPTLPDHITIIRSPQGAP